MFNLSKEVIFSYKAVKKIIIARVERPSLPTVLNKIVSHNFLLQTF